MQRRNLFTAVLLSLATLGAGAAVAASQADGQRGKLDANGDGVIDRTEAAASPRMAAGFDKLDADTDGKLSREEMPKGGHHRGGRRGGGIERLDTDGDGRISQQEAAASQRIGDTFSAMDLDRDGYVVRTELRSYQAKQRPAREAEMRKRMDQKFAEADLNKDGKLSKLEVSEKMPRLAKGFAWADDDRDGFLSKSELEAGRDRFARR